MLHKKRDMKQAGDLSDDDADRDSDRHGSSSEDMEDSGDHQTYESS